MLCKCYELQTMQVSRQQVPAQRAIQSATLQEQARHGE